MYTTYNIENHEDPGLTHDDLIFVALLVGGDYSVSAVYSNSDVFTGSLKGRDSWLWG